MKFSGGSTGDGEIRRQLHPGLRDERELCNVETRESRVGAPPRAVEIDIEPAAASGDAKGIERKPKAAVRAAMRGKTRVLGPEQSRAIPKAGRVRS